MIMSATTPTWTAPRARRHRRAAGSRDAGGVSLAGGQGMSCIPSPRSWPAPCALALSFVCAGAASAAAQPRFGPIQKDGCTGPGLRQVSGPLRNVPFGADAIAACQLAARNVLGTSFARPDRCVADGLFGARGQWDVRDTSCLAAPPPAPVRGGEGALRSGAPLEGYADLHVHKMGQIGFIGTVVCGC